MGQSYFVVWFYLWMRFYLYIFLNIWINSIHALTCLVQIWRTLIRFLARSQPTFPKWSLPSVYLGAFGIENEGLRVGKWSCPQKGQAKGPEGSEWGWEGGLHHGCCGVERFWWSREIQVHGRAPSSHWHEKKRGVDTQKGRAKLARLVKSLSQITRCSRGSLLIEWQKPSPEVGSSPGKTHEQKRIVISLFLFVGLIFFFLRQKNHMSPRLASNSMHSWK